MIILSVDLGKARTGLAICDKNEILAYPLCVLKEKSLENLAQKISEKISENKVQKIILGLPKNMDGSLGESAKRAQEFAEILKAKTNTEVVLWDERQTTISAHQYLNETNVRGKKRKSIIDTVSATIILESYLQYKKSIKKDL